MRSCVKILVSGCGSERARMKHDEHPPHTIFIFTLLSLVFCSPLQRHHNGSQHARSGNNNPHLPIRRKTLGPLGVCDSGLGIIASSWREFGQGAQGWAVESVAGKASDNGAGSGGLELGEEGRGSGRGDEEGGEFAVRVSVGERSSWLKDARCAVDESEDLMRCAYGVDLRWQRRTKLYNAEAQS